jgi:hypothetical protein
MSVTPAQWTRANDLFHAALTQPPDTRDAWLADAAADDPMVLAEVRSLLVFHAQAAGALDTPVIDLSMDGARLGPYRILREVGHGGLGVVYLAEDTRLGRTVALKAIAPETSDHPARRDLLRREARALATLSHPGLAVVYALEEIDDDLYLASEFIQGQTLREELQHGPLPLSQVIATGRDLADALLAAHDHGLVHRDLKPDNIMRTTTGRVKIIDFGLAGAIDGPSPGGTPAYMAPEQHAGGPVDIRADHYALGLILHEMATGTLPDTSTFRSPLPATSPAAVALDAVIARCLSPEPDARFAATRDLRDALARLDAPTDTAATMGTPAPPATPSAGTRAAFSALWWWQFHQLITSVGYGIGLYFLWVARQWQPDAPGASWMFLGGVAAALTANTLRLHLWFTSLYHLEDWHTQRLKVWGLNRLADGLFGILLLVSGAQFSDREPALAALFVGSAITVLIAFTVIEPATTRAAARTILPTTPTR